jgi:hypothetical protein
LGGPNITDNPAIVPVSKLGYYSYLSKSWYSN